MYKIIIPANSIALSKSAFSELEPFSGSGFSVRFSGGTTPRENKIINQKRIKNNKQAIL